MQLTNPIQLPDSDGVNQSWTDFDGDVKMNHELQPNGEPPINIATINVFLVRFDSDGNIHRNTSYPISFVILFNDNPDPVIIEQGRLIYDAIVMVLRAKKL